MSTLELRQKITEQISHIDDVSFLNAIKVIIESKVSEVTYKLSDYQKKRIVSARQQIKNGQTIADVDLQKEVDQWLSSK